MNKQYWVIIFFIVLAAHLTGLISGHELIQDISKPLLMPVLAWGFISQTQRLSSNLKTWILSALFFSWAGDILLMFQDKDKLYFLLGLTSFLLAHICYIILFHRIRVEEKVKPNPWFMLIVLLYYITLISWLAPYLGDMKLPVRIYGIVISFMFMLAMHMLYIKNKTAGRFMMIGALLFLLSDTADAVHLFYLPFTMDGFIIMLTYGLAQLCIVYGAIRYIRNSAD